MFLSDTSIKRPVMAIVISLLLCVFGYVSFLRLPVQEMPTIDNPVVSIRVTYTGASAAIMESQVTKPIEDQLTGISGIDTITSASRVGSSRITVNFVQGMNLNEGLSDVRDAVAKAQRHLPTAADAPIVSKNSGTSDPSIYINLASDIMDRTQLTDYANRVLIDRFNLIPGVSSIALRGSLKQVMYVKLDPLKMAGHGITTADITNSLHNENLEMPSGQIRNDVMAMSVRVSRLYYTPDDFKKLKIRQTSDGKIIYLEDIADVWVGAENENSTYHSNGRSTLSFTVTIQSDANPINVSKAVSKEVDAMQPFLPKATSLSIDYDANIFIERSIHEVYITLLTTGALVLLILYLFIGQVKATLIPAVTVPVSLIATFIIAHAFGFSINLITLMALILAIGLVVDDAIVVVENVFHHIEQGEPPLIAAYKGTREVGFAVLATTFVLVMVFLPITFMQGITGRLFTEFAVFLAFSVLFSCLIALTLTPVLSNKLLRKNTNKNRLVNGINWLFNKIEHSYANALNWMMSWRILAPIMIILCLGGSWFLYKNIPSQLAPVEDRGIIYIKVTGAPATSYNRMMVDMTEIEKKLMPFLNKGEVKAFNMQTPAFGGRAGDNTGFLIVQLVDWGQRSRNATQILNDISKLFTTMPDVSIRVFTPGFRGGSSNPIQFVLQGSNFTDVNKWAEILKTKAETSPIIQSLDSDYSETTPELLVHINKTKASELGISVNDIGSTLQIMLGGLSVTTYVDKGEEYDVYLRGDEDKFNNANDLSRIYFKTNSGAIVSLDSVATVEEQASAQTLNHNNKRKAITLSGAVANGYTLGQALDYLDTLAIQLLPKDISIAYSGESLNFKNSQNDTIMIFMLALIVVYLVLAAQFESFINPLVVMFTVPTGILGGLFGLWFMGGSLNMYSQIGLILLIGIVTKNGILIVEFANQLRDQGRSFEQAIIDASIRRLRPILMTASTAIFGALPLLLSSGAGAESRIAVGTVVFFGLVISTFITLFIIPAMYRLLSKNTKSPGFVAAQLQQMMAQQNKIDY